MQLLKVVAALSVLLMIAAILLNGTFFTAHPAYALWDGNESVADYAKRAGIKDSQITLDLDDNVTMKLTLIPAGKFLMGSPANEKDRRDGEGPQRDVTISKPFYMGVCTVTQEQYQKVTSRLRDASNFIGPKNPVDRTNWAEAAGFCKRLSQRTGKTVRLPTEAEWEYACRAGHTSRFHFGDDEDKLGDYAWYNKNSENTTHPVGQKKPNDWGLCDMHGNVLQWCADWYGKDSYAKARNTDPTGPGAGQRHVLRGGGWFSSPVYCRTAYRNWFIPFDMTYNIGFRVVVELESVGNPAPSRPRRPPAKTPSTHSTYPLWDGAETVADYTKRAGIKDAQIRLWLDGGVTMRLALMPAGKFMMGSPDSEKDHCEPEGPQHEVTISRPFYIGVYSVTQEQWRSIMGTTLVQQRDSGDKSFPINGEGYDYPMYYVSWEEADEFCVRLSEKMGRTVRLPTEAEWEYACRAGSTSRFYFGDDENKLGDYAWYRQNSDGKTHPVGKKKPNAWGLYDMQGNVGQFCADWYEDYAKEPARDPQGPDSGLARVQRGGAYITDAYRCRSATRDNGSPDGYSLCDGFRVVVDLK